MINQQRLDLLISTAESMGLNPKQVDNLGLISVEIDGQEHYLFHKVSNPNNPMASWLSENKYVSRIIFDRHGLPNIPFSLPKNEDEALQFLASHGKIIGKPIKGKHSEDINLITDPSGIQKLSIDEYILEKFVKGQEVRVLVVSGKAVAVHHKVYDTEINNPDTVKRISLEEKDWDPKLVETAVKAADVIGLSFTAVDFLVTDDSEMFLLEINSAPGLDRFQEPNEGPSIDAMRLYLELVVKNYS